MIDYLYKINNHSFKFGRETSLSSRVIRFLVRATANFILPIYFFFSNKNRHKCLPSSNEIIVSLTSFPARISRVWLVIETILHQTLKPVKIMLWLSKDQFPRGMSELPRRLVSQTSRGLDIKFVDGDIRSHKKYYYCFKEYPDSVVFMIDDDILYPSNIVSYSYSLLQEKPSAIIANFGFEFFWDDNKGYISYVRNNDSRTVNTSFFFGTGGGTMLCPSKLNQCIDPLEKIIKMCPTADDIYLNGIARIAKMDILVASNNPLITLMREKTSLLSENGTIGDPNSNNAKQLKALVKHCEEQYGINPFFL